MTAKKWQYGLNWYVRMPDGKPLNLNTGAAADTILGLWEYIEQLEARRQKRETRAGKRKQQATDE